MSVSYDSSDVSASWRRRQRDRLISAALILATAGGLGWYWLNGHPTLGVPKTQVIAAACPQAGARLNSYEYELQRRRCEAVAVGALETVERQSYYRRNE